MELADYGIQQNTPATRIRSDYVVDVTLTDVEGLPEFAFAKGYQRNIGGCWRLLAVPILTVDVLYYSRTCLARTPTAQCVR
jgi:hypothetical protein